MLYCSCVFLNIYGFKYLARIFQGIWFYDSINIPQISTILLFIVISFDALLVRFNSVDSFWRYKKLLNEHLGPKCLIREENASDENCRKFYALLYGVDKIPKTSHFSTSKPKFAKNFFTCILLVHRPWLPKRK